MIQRMIDVRIDHDESQRELAAAIGYHQVQIARYETGQNTPPIAYLVKFCQHYHVSADYILGLPRDGQWPRERGGDARALSQHPRAAGGS